MSCENGSNPTVYDSPKSNTLRTSAFLCGYCFQLNYLNPASDLLICRHNRSTSLKVGSYCPDRLGKGDEAKISHNACSQSFDISGVVALVIQ